ncbi:MAG: MBL fold metallo-hydrolase [Promethearchaeota archaeon]|nr:MAG: MBL fold metallo-hydrolase [Candidatus Lokiarchaeota archaeon]
MFEYENVRIRWLGHDFFQIKGAGVVIYMDPYKLKREDLASADLIITSHEHFDHCDFDAINHLSDEKTILIGPKICQDKLQTKILVKKDVKELNPYEELTIGDIQLSAIPAYNIHRFRSPGNPFHPEESGHIGTIIDIDGTTIYHAGDTDKIPDMDDIHPDIALLPVSGTYVMDVEEAVEAAKVLDPKVIIPMHLGRGIGELSFAEEFQNKLPNMRVEILPLEE